MNLIKLQNEIADDEGVKYEIYKCSEGYPTGGIGHLITEWDEEYYEQPIGTKIPNEQVDDWFAKDIQVTLKDCKIIFEEFDSLPQEAQLVIANMCFQLGRPRLSKFKNFIAAVKDQDWDRAADEMKDSRWYKQTTARAERLISRIQVLGVPV
jgi:GH24 family phage-related lysozyme (muramidase)